MTSVYVTVPNGEGWLHKRHISVISGILNDSRYNKRVDCPTHRPYVNNLHHCIKDFLRGGEDYWLTMDADNPPLNNPFDLVELDLDLIGLPTPVWNSDSKRRGDRPWYFNALDAKADGYTPHYPCEGLQEVYVVGSGCILVARRVLEKLRYRQPFVRQWLVDGTVGISGDYSFCEKVRAAGFRIWAHFDYLCEHFNELPLLEVIKAFDAFYKKEFDRWQEE